LHSTPHSKTINNNAKFAESCTLSAGFLLNDIHIKPNRGEVHLPSGIISLEPKVMDVLVTLSQKSGEVISAEELFALVWPKSIYNPVSVRRCIAVLRKTFDDDNKTLIKTHPKRGYSLTADIEVIPSDVGGEANEGLAKSPQNKMASYIISSLCVLLLIVFGWYAITTGTNSNIDDLVKSKSWHVNNLRPITANTADETYSQHSSIDDEVIFIRQRANNGAIISELWRKNIENGDSSLILASNEQIKYFAVMSSTRQQKMPNELHIVIALMQDNGIKFEHLSVSQQGRVERNLHTISVSDISRISPFTVDDLNIYFIANKRGIRTLQVASFSDKHVEPLLAGSRMFSPYRITGSDRPNAITVIGFDERHISQVKRYSLQTGDLTHIATLDANWYFIEKHPLKTGYLLSDGKGLFQLNERGEKSPIVFENYAFLHYPSLSRDGSKITYTQSSIQGDISAVDLVSGQHNKLTSATSHDWQGVMSPDKKRLAFVSNRHGHSQLFVLDLESQHLSLVYDNPSKHLALAKPVWSPDGRQLASARNEHLFLVDFSEQAVKVSYFDEIIGHPSQWFQQEDALLVIQNHGGVTYWHKFEPKSKTQSLVAKTDEQIILDQHDNRYIVSERELKRFGKETVWQVSESEKIMKAYSQHEDIYLLVESQEHNAKSMSVWRYLVDEQQIAKLLDVDVKDVDVSDINAQSIIMSNYDVEKNIVVLDIQ